MGQAQQYQQTPQGAQRANPLRQADPTLPGQEPPVREQERSQFIELGIGTQLTGTSNANYGSEPSQSDAILQISPRITLRSIGPRVQVFGSAALDGEAFARQTEDNRWLPSADLTARLEAIERWLFIEGAVRSIQTSADPFGARPLSGGPTGNTLTTAQGRLSPYLEHGFDDRTRFRLRSDNTWTDDDAEQAGLDSASAAGYYGLHTFVVERDPAPSAHGWKPSVPTPGTTTACRTISPSTSRG